MLHLYGRFRKSSYTGREIHHDKHRFEHWYRDNTVYFITARCRNGFAAFDSAEAKRIFWDRHDHYCAQYGFEPWVTTLMNNHYHDLGYLRLGENLGPLIQRIHGSVAKLVNDTLEVRLVPFWREAGNRDYFDGCIRDVLQLVRAHRYTLMQAVRAGLVRDWREYPDTHLLLESTQAVQRATQLRAFLEDVPYARYDRRRSRTNRGR